MNLSFLAPNRTVLLLSDEALYIYKSTARGVSLVETIPWEADNFQQNVAGVLSKDCGGKPVLILNDMVEQHYRKERVLKGGVGTLDRKKMIQRKLAATFPNYPVRAALPLKEKLPKTDKRAAADIYIFAAIPGSPQFVQSVEAAKRSMVSLAAFCLLPVESSDMVRTLSDKLSKDKKGKAKWTLFMGQHRNGGLRQIVTKDGELALTRMTPITGNHENVASWSAEAHQEFKATMSYLSRFGYQVEDGLNLILVSDADAGEAFEQRVEESCHFYSLSTFEAAQILGVPLGRQTDTHCADILHVAWAGRKSRFMLPMRASQLEQVSKPRQVAVAATLILLAGAAFFGYQFVSLLGAQSSLSSDLSDARQKTAQLDVQFQREVQRKKDLGFDVLLIQNSAKVHDSLEAERIKILEVFNASGRALGRDLRLDKILVQRPDNTAISSFLRQGANAPLFQASLQMTFPANTNIDQGNKEVSDLRRRIETLLPAPDYTVEVAKFLKDYEYVEELVVESGDFEKQDVQQDFVAEIKITGLRKQDEAVPEDAQQEEYYD